jgi:hypothetical protein
LKRLFDLYNLPPHRGQDFFHELNRPAGQANPRFLPFLIDARLIGGKFNKLARAYFKTAYLLSPGALPMVYVIEINQLFAALRERPFVVKPVLQ